MISEDAYVSDEEELECPLCMEEFDISDRTFKPCPCGYQICRFCYNRIVNSETANGCPACRRQYTEETVEFKPLSAEEWKKDQQRIHSRKLKEKEKRDSEMASRRHLSNMRVVQKNLVYVIGFSPKSADADLAATLRGNDYFAQYGKINKIVVNKKSHPNGQPTVGVYITYAKKEDAARAVQAVDNTMNDGRVLRASFGTTKYCSAYLRQQVCQNPNCMYLHEPGEDLDSYTREDMSTIQHAAKAAEGMHANALAAHHMRRQPSRADSSNNSIQDDSNTAALPPTASWASMPKPLDTFTAQEAGGNNTAAQSHTKPDSLPAPSIEISAHRGEIPPPPSQTAQDSVPPSDLLPPPVQMGLNHPYLGGTMKTLFEGRFSFNFAPRVLPGLSETDVKSAENFPQLFSWDPQIRRPSSPSKNGKNHGRSGSRYAFAAESKTPPPGFIPPGLVTGLQPPGFSAGGQAPAKEGATDFFSQFLRNANSSDSATSEQIPYEDPAIVGLRETRVEASKSKSNVLDTLQLNTDGIIQSRPTTMAPGLGPAIAVPRFSPFDNKTEQNSSSFLASSTLELEKPQSKFGASFAKLENLESQAQEITMKTDQKARSTWEPTSRPRDSAVKATSHPLARPSSGPNDMLLNPIAFSKSSGTWQPSPPPPKISLSPSPKPTTTAGTVPQKLGSSVKAVNKIPWEPSPPPTTSRTNSPLKNNQSTTLVQSTGANSTINDVKALRPQIRSTESQQSILAQDDFPALNAASQQPEIVAPMAHTPTKKMWDTIAPVVVTPISPLGTPKGSRTPVRRDSAQSAVSSMADRGRSRQNSTAELPSRVTTPRDLSPAISPIASRAASPVMTPTLNRTTSALNAVPVVSSPLAALNTGKQIRIVSNKATEEAKIKAEKLAAEERAIKKIKADEAAAAAKSMIRKSVPLASVKKTKEQRQAEQRDRAEKRESASAVSSQPEEAPAPAEIAPIIGRARKQKNKSGVTKTPTKASVKTPTATNLQAEDGARESDSHDADMEAEVEVEVEAEVEEVPEEEPMTDAKTAASDAISALSKELDLRQYKFFQTIPGLMHHYDLSAVDLKLGAELLHSSTYAGKETIEQLEKLLASARKEANETFRVLEECQKRNIKFARLGISMPA